MVIDNLELPKNNEAIKAAQDNMRKSLFSSCVTRKTTSQSKSDVDHRCYVLRHRNDEGNAILMSMIRPNID